MAKKLSESLPQAEMVDIAHVCRVYLGGASARHARRMIDQGLMPAGRKLGALRRWSRAELDQWVAEGCKPVRSGRCRKGVAK